MKIEKIKKKPEKTFKEKLMGYELEAEGLFSYYLRKKSGLMQGPRRCQSELARNMRDGRHRYETSEEMLDRTPQNIDFYLQRVAREFQCEFRDTDYRNVFGRVVADYFNFWKAMTGKTEVRYLDALRFVKDLRKLENRTRSTIRDNAYNKFKTIAFITGFGDCALDNGDLETAAKAYETAGVAGSKHVARRLKKYGLELSS